MKIKQNSGQTLLIIVLIAAVILTVGLAVASYSITDIKISQQEEESARAFSAAEAGIEEALKLGALPEGGSITVGNITAKLSEVTQGGGHDFDFGGLTFASGELANVWLISHTPEGELNPEQKFTGNQTTLCWGEASQVSENNPPALEASLIFKDTDGKYKVIRSGFDPKNNRTVGFEGADDRDGGNCGNLAFAKNINLGSGTFSLPAGATPYLLRLKLLYNNQEQPLAVSADSNLPEQGKCFDSTATTESNISRKVRQCKFFEAPPAIFDYVLFSGSSLAK